MSFNPTRSPVKAVIFDLDGTLVESSLDFDQIRRDIACPAGQDILGFIEGLDSLAKEQAEQCVREYEYQDAQSAKIISGARELLDRLQQQNLQQAILTRNSFEATQLKLKQVQLHIETVLTREDAPPKPDPAGLLHLSKQWGLMPEQCVYVGDYLYDLQAARNAGMHACLYLDITNEIPSYLSQADFVCRDYSAFESDLLAYLKGIIR